MVEYAKACCKCAERRKGERAKVQKARFQLSGREREEGRKGGSRILLVSQWRQWTDVIRIYRRWDAMVLLLPKAEMIFCGNLTNSKFKEDI